MKKLLILISLLTLLIVSCSDDEDVTKPNSELLKEEAAEFALKVVNCYFTQDTTFFASILPETLYMVDPSEPPYETSYFIIPNMISSYDYSDYSLEEYIEVYDYEIVDYATYSSQYVSWMDALEYWKPTKDDFLFLGNRPFEDKVPFMSFTRLVFLVTKSSGEWKLKASY